MKRTHLEIIWLTSLIAITLLIFHFIFDINEINNTVKITLSGTFIFLAAYVPLFIIGVTVIFIAYLIRILENRYQYISVNILFLIANVLMTIVVGSIAVWKYLFWGWTIYPPSSHLQETGPKKVIDPSVVPLLIFTFLLFAFGCFVAYQTLKRKKEARKS